MKYRLISLREHDAFMNMALEEAIMESVAAGKSLPTIRFFKWNSSAVSIGYFQGIEHEVNLEECKKQGLDIVRRMTGGGAVFHDREGEITYSVIAPVSEFPKGITESYEAICKMIMLALKDLGIKGEFKPINDVLVNGMKISGSAQTRKKGVLVQHGTLLIEGKQEKVLNILRGKKSKHATNLTKSSPKIITFVKDHSDAKKEKIIKSLEKGFTHGIEFYMGDYTNEEIEIAEKLAKEKYSTKDWNHMR